MAADLQNKHPNPCRLAPSGSFGSKFVTVCVSGQCFSLCSCLTQQVMADMVGPSWWCAPLLALPPPR